MMGRGCQIIVVSYSNCLKSKAANIAKISSAAALTRHKWQNMALYISLPLKLANG